MIKVLINCPGGWSHGLDSPERGEGRWAQNLARSLSKTGLYEVTACSGGVPTWGRGERANVSLCSEKGAAEKGPYDIYLDASWWDKKKPVGEARAYVHVHFGYEPRLGVPFPPGHYLAHVLKRQAPNYVGEGRGNADRTFYLPAPFCSTMKAYPYLDALPGDGGLIHTMRGSDAPGRLGRFGLVYEAVRRLRDRGIRVPFAWLSSAGLESPRHDQDVVVPMQAAWGVPYCELRALLAKSALNISLDGWSNILDCTSLGVPSLAWEGGADPAAYEIAKEFDLHLTPDDGVDRVTEVVELLLTDRPLAKEYVEAFQAEFSDHVDAVAQQRFAEMAARVLA